MITFSLLGCAALLHDHSAPKFEVRYGGCLADRNDVRTILHILSRERWADVWRTVHRLDMRGAQASLKELAFGRVYRVAGADWAGSPAAVVMYRNTINESRSLRYALRYHNGKWVRAGGDHHDFAQERWAKECVAAYEQVRSGQTFP
jgi:hypothetical protein